MNRIRIKTLFKSISLVLSLFVLSEVTAQPETLDTVFICKNDCSKIGVKSKKGFKYEWKAFGRDIDEVTSKIKICPSEQRDLYYVNIYDKENHLTETKVYKVIIRQEKITFNPANPCIKENEELTIEVVENFKKYKWSNGKKSKKVKFKNVKQISVKVMDGFGCYHEEQIEVTSLSNKEIKKKLDEAGFYTIPVKIKKNK